MWHSKRYYTCYSKAKPRNIRLPVTRLCRELPRPPSECNTSEVLELAHFTAEDTKPVFMVTQMVLNHWQQLTTASCSFECCCHPYTVKH